MTLKKINIQQLLLDQSAMKHTAVLENIFHLIIIYSYCICIDY